MVVAESDALPMATTKAKVKLNARGDAKIAEVLESFHAQTGFRVEDVDASVLAHAVARAKKIGNEHFAAKAYDEAIKAYTTAIAGCDTDKSLYSNRSAAELAMGYYDDALRDAAKCVQLDKTWAKGYYRLGCALMAVFESGKAILAFQEGLRLSPDSADMKERLEVARERHEDERERLLAETKATRRDFALKLRDARAQDRRTEMENQWKQTLGGPEWDMEDYEWRPTFIPQMCTRKLDSARFEMDPARLNMITYAQAIAELATPKKALKVLEDTVRVAAYRDAIELTVGDFESEELQSALVLSAGGGVLPMITARAGAKRVISIERNRFLYRMSKQILKSNAGKFEKGAIQMLDQKLETCSLAEPIAAPDDSNKQPQVVPEASQLVVTDLFDHATLGLGLLRAIDHVGKHKLATPNARVIPSRVRVMAQLIELRLDQVNGFDLSALNAYRWHPQAAKQDLYSEPHSVLSDPFEVSDLNIQDRLAAALRGDGEGRSKNGTMEQDDYLHVKSIKDGLWNAIAFWFECELCDGVELKSYDVDGDKSAAASSWGAAVHYLDEIPIKLGDDVEVRVRRDADRFYFDSTPPATRPRHASIPSWHYDMLNDSSRNAAYEKAIKRAIVKRKDMNLKNEVLDVGAGSGLLSMFAMRAGADSVYAAEMSNHMCDAGEETVCMNGYGTKIMFLNRDARRLFTKESEGLIKHGLKPDGNYPEMERKADILVYEVFDSGLIGEGALHIVGMAKHRLLCPDATMIPCAASVYAQPIQIRIDDVSDFDCAQANRWRWRNDYEGINLELCPDKWKPLAPFKEVFDFDFHKYTENLSPANVELDFDIDTDGVFNAVVFWFKLQLDDETELTTSPYVGARKGKTWQQAVQYVEELKVRAGDTMPLVASHDSYGIKFEVNDIKLKNRVALRTGVPAWDPSWHVAHEAMSDVSGDITKAVVQNPIMYRTAAETAVALGSRPQDFSLAADEGADYCLRFMS